MSVVGVTDFNGGMKIMVEGQPFTIVSSQFVKPGKGQPFARVKLRHLTNQRVIEKTFKSGEKFELADVVDTSMRLLYTDNDGAVLMDDNTFDQVTIGWEEIGDAKDWLKDDIVYAVVIYQGNPVSITPPTFMELEVAETDPGARGDTASGRVLKPGVTETGAKVQIPIFIEQGEVCKFDTRTSDYVSRAQS